MPWLALLGCFAPEPAPPPPAVAPDPAPAPAPAKRKGKRRDGGRRQGGGERSDPQAPIPASGVPDPLRGLTDADVCRSDTLLLVKYGFEALQQGKCAEVCCTADPEHWCCGLDWPSSDVMRCDEYAVMRNGIFARYGYPFSEARWRDLFAGEPYYRRREDFDATWLSATASENVALLRRREDAHEGCLPE